MKPVPKPMYQTPEQIEDRIRELENCAMLLRAESDEHREIMREITQLGIYAKRWLAGAAKKQRGLSSAR
jgi:hypothetical protein